MSLLALSTLNLEAVLLLFSALWLIAQLNRDPSFVDAFWALGIVLIALIGHAMTAGATWRHTLILGLVLLWGVRLATHLFLRWRAEGADRRYVKLLSDVRQKRGWSYARTTLLFIFLPQAALLWLTSLPVQFGQAFGADAGLGPVAAFGALLAVFGIGFETVADHQLRRFRHEPGNEGRVLDAGLWAWSRHPNYFGEACVWWGLWLIAAETGWGALALPAPVFVTFTLLKLSGISLQEADIQSRRPEYEAYRARTPAFIPRPPRHS
ncbi:DUF1295 domain-containing protein [Oceanicaulis sp. LC35]|uniref:DUF1295 domain-containing protein n=1 Tax=Oceanicaulis sp. LC35 TaxID=3349635 RepID=UPI003F858596